MFICYFFYPLLHRSDKFDGRNIPVSHHNFVSKRTAELYENRTVIVYVKKVINIIFNL